jgi:hypothetical protein
VQSFSESLVVRVVFFYLDYTNCYITQPTNLDDKEPKNGTPSSPSSSAQEGDDDITQPTNLDDKEPKNGTPSSPPPSEDIFTSRRHSMDYFIVDGVILRTGYSNKLLWYLLCIKELLDNAVDFLVKNYKGADDTLITIDISKDDNLFHIKVRNSNHRDVPVFANKEAIFDYEQRYGSKQDVHIISRGMLGDAMKQILAFGYVLIHTHDSGDILEDKQWERSLIIRHNKKEFKIYLKVDKVRQTGVATIYESDKEIMHSDTEIEFVLPIIDEVRNTLDIVCIEAYCKKYPLFTTDITFKFRITDNSTPISESVSDITRAVVSAITPESPRTTINIEYKALHPISTESWNKQNSIHSYTREEFKRRFVNMDINQAANTRAYDILATYREGTNLKKTLESEISVAELLSLPEQEQNKKIECFYNQLYDAISTPPDKLSLPYTTNKGKRKTILRARLALLYDNLDKDKASYKSVHACYKDGKRRISYPYFFEILAIPFANPVTARNVIVFIGATNYSISPKEDSNIFDGNYDGFFPYAYSEPKDIRGVLEQYGFHSYAQDSAKIPCLIIANLVTPRRDPHGYDKSRIDINPFTKTIVQAVKRLASEIRSYRAMGIYFSKPAERHTALQSTSGRGQLEQILTDYLRENHGLPA